MTSTPSRWLAGALLAVLLCGAAHAQTAGTIEFAAATTTGDGSVTPVLTWSTTPAATSCAASGDWTGVKAASGTETLPDIVRSATYVLTCTWDDRSATLTWTAPTQNVDGSDYTDPGGYRIEYGPSTALGQSVAVDDPAATTYTFNALAAGTWHFGLHAVNQRGAESALTNLVSKTLGSASGNRSVGITVNALPNPPTNLTVR